MELQQSPYAVFPFTMGASSSDMDSGFCGSNEGWGPLSKSRFGLTPCFEYSILLGALSILAIAAFFGRYVALRTWSKPHGHGRTAWIYWPTQVCMSAVGVTSVLILVHLLHNDGATPATVFGYSALATAWLLAVPLNYYEHIYSIRSSDIIFSFYVLTLAALSIQVRTLYLLSDHSQDTPFQLVATLFIISILLTGFIVEAWPRGSTKEKFSITPAEDSTNGSINSSTSGDDGSYGKTSLTYGLFLVVAMFVIGLANSVLLTVSRQYCIVRGLEVRSALLSMVYRKSLKLSPGARQVSTLGSITSHMSVDADYWLEGGIFLTTWVAVPLEIFLGLVLLHRLLGWSAWVGFLTMLTITPLQVWRARIFEKLQRQKTNFIDERIRLTTEVLSAIKIVKLYAWEDAFLKRILDVRNMELGVLRHMGVLYAVMSIVFNSLTLIICLVTLSVYAKWGGPEFTPGTLTPQIVFVSMTLFALLKVPIASMTETATATVTLTVGTSRIQAFLLQEENNPDAIVRQDISGSSAEEPSVVIQEATFSWLKESNSTNKSDIGEGEDADETQTLLQGSQDGESVDIQRPTLQRINLSVKSGSLVAIVGRVGQGKSSLLSALIGEMYKFHGHAKTIGRIAYVPQQSWILNATLRDNILFGLEYDQERYSRIIAASGLGPDLTILPAGDQTEIGERGINLSGGQRQRVALARAAYNDADIYLLDDPLSAVDAHVDQHLWRELIGPQGLLRNKTRLLVTHGIHHLQEVDQIILLKDGCVAETGHFEDLMASGQTFCQLICEYAATHRSQGGSSASSGAESDKAKTQSQRTIDSSTGVDAASAAAKHGDVGTKDTKKDMKKNKRASIINAENILDGGLSASIFLRYLRAITYKYAMLIMLFQVLMQVCYVGTSLWLKYWIGQNEDSDPAARPSLGLFLSVFSGLTLVYVLMGIVLFWVAFGVARIHASEYLHRIFMRRIMRLPPAFFDTTPLGRIINRVSSDFASIDDRIPWKLFEAIGHAVSLVASLMVVAFTTPLFLVASPFIALIYYCVQKHYLRASQAVKRICRATQSPIYQHFQETLAGVSTIRAMDLQDRFITASAGRSDLYSNSFIAMAYCIRWMEILVQMVNVVITLLACLWFVLLPQGSVNSATAGLALSFAMSNSQSLIWFARTYSDLYVHLIAVERVQEYAELKTEAPLSTAPDSEAGRALDRHWPQDGRIEFVDYSTRYREGMDLVLKGISFTVEGGQKVGIVGRTGAGKSSLTLALFRMIEAANSEWAKASSNTSNPEVGEQGEEDQVDGGKIVIDQIDISTLGLADLRKNLAIIPQEPVLFAGTVRENIDPFGELEDAVLWEALERSYLKSVISTLPGGLNFEVAQNGENFSVGQRSLICLARALLRKTKILVLDEATSAVDIETDELIQKTIRSEFKDRTILTIAHRIKTVMDSDKILVLDHGRVVEFDEPKVLLQDESSLFYKLAKQAGEV
ncbi:hypothetical protein BGZ95_001991 [Linnemannia exigua]|uniref:P-loop containing nucleoside triphosphate hydrolase protein n=1 Tax=Linnemannia exigua TaxID=604196 RepID=A0AAD4H9M2_9FUNG|nr:hypothetical protein BGZ95_001991 [Linnemannia exigua]